jgi:hypothetical protein
MTHRMDVINVTRRSVPVSLILLVVAAAWAALQAVPVVGLILMFVLAPFWSVLFINAAFVGTGVEAIMGRVSRYWLILPLLWFGGYACVAAGDHVAMASLSREFEQHNASVKIPFDLSEHTLVFRGANSAATDMVDNYAVPVAYDENANFKGASHIAYRLIDNAICKEIRDTRATGDAGINVLWFHDTNGNGVADSVFEDRFCNLQQPEDPALPVYIVETQETKTSVGSLPVTLTTTTVTTPDGRTFVLKGGFASPLGWLPLPVVGCMQWTETKCDAAFWRNSPTSLIAKKFRFSPDPSLARALGLTPVAREARVAVDAEGVAKMVEEKRQSVVTEELATLDAVIDDVTTKTDSVPFRSLTTQIALLEPRLPGMVAAVERGVGEPKGRSNAQQVFGLIKSMPGDKVAPYKARLDALWVQDSWFEFSVGSETGRDGVLPDRCKTPAQRAMSELELKRDLADRRNRTIDAAAITAAYRDPDCHPRDAFGDIYIGRHNGASVKLDWRNGHVVVFYTPGTLAKFDGRSGYSSDWLRDQSCQSVQGIELKFGPTSLCAPAVVAPDIARDADSLR